MSVVAADPARLGTAAAVVVAWIVLCGATAWRERRRRRGAAGELAALARAANRDGGALLVVHASQTGAAERLAWETARALHGAGHALRVVALGALSPQELARHRRALFVAATTGEGDPPDAAGPFVRRHMAQPDAASLAGLDYAVLALGDRSFADFCGFGRRLDDWLAGRGARRLFRRVEVDGLDAGALDRWRDALGDLGADDRAMAVEAPLQRWRLAARRELNPGSQGAPVFLLELEPPAGAAPPAWESGDLVQVLAPAATRPREYSIASIPADGRLHLVVRRERRADGGTGLASGWLTGTLAPGAEVPLRLVAHPGFRLGANRGRPLILVGNGTGIAGLRGHLRTRAVDGAPRQWLLFGERERTRDFLFGDEIDAWQAAGVLQRVDLAFSRDQAERIHVQHHLRAEAARVREWVADGAAIYVCGSLRGMAAGVDEALVEILGRDALDGLLAQGRYRRDVY